MLPFVLIIHHGYEVRHVHAILKNVPRGIGALLVYALREEAVRWYSHYRQQLAAQPEAAALTDAEINRLVHELR